MLFIPIIKSKKILFTGKNSLRFQLIVTISVTCLNNE
jgi:hypothetical protein